MKQRDKRSKFGIFANPTWRPWIPIRFDCDLGLWPFFSMTFGSKFKFTVETNRYSRAPGGDWWVSEISRISATPGLSFLAPFFLCDLGVKGQGDAIKSNCYWWEPGRGWESYYIYALAFFFSNELHTQWISEYRANFTDLFYHLLSKYRKNCELIFPPWIEITRAILFVI